VVRVTVPGEGDDYDRLRHTLATALDPEAIIFDLDGVLADVSQSQIQAIIATAESFGVRISPSDIEAVKAEGNSNDDWVVTHRLCAANGVEVPIEAVVDRFERLYQGDGTTPGLKLAERALVDPETWARWSRRWPIGVVTGRPRPDADEFLERFGLAGSISALVTREDAPLKPDPAPVTRVLDLLGVSRAWMLGDTPDDVAAARGAGVVPIGVIAPGDDPALARDRLRLAARILDDINELEGLLP
jgi:HAD superfamily hydrolase (TIGR01548 family)